MRFRSSIGFIVSAFVFFILANIAFVIIRPVKPTPQYPPVSNIHCDGCNVVFILFDTLRRDHVGAYGYRRPTTPTIDEFAKSAFVFDDAVTVAPWTLPSVMSMFTGMYPSNHGVTNKQIIMPNGVETDAFLMKTASGAATLARVLKDNGYVTAGYTGGAALNRSFGFSMGFDIYSDSADFAGLENSFADAWHFVERHQKERFFLFLHGYDIHGSFVPQDGYDRRFINPVYHGRLTGSAEEEKDLREEGITKGKISMTPEDVRFLTGIYDEKVARADAVFGKFLATYRKYGLMEKTVFIIVSDHGEELYDHGRIDHGHSLYDELIRIPFVIRVPGIGQQIRVSGQVRSIDIAPTLLTLLGIQPAETVRRQWDGENLVPMMAGKRIPLVAFPETDYRYSVFLRAVRDEAGRKIIRDAEFKSQDLWFDTARDAAEKNNLHGHSSNVFETLSRSLDEHMVSFR